MITDLDDEFVVGYCDGRDAEAPEPSANRSAAYCHSFAVGRAELNNQPIPASISRARARDAIAEEQNR